MELIAWKPEYSTGHREIDLQHQFFADLINRLDEEIGASDDWDYQKNLFWELSKYAEFHFLSEENIIYKAGIGGLENQKKLHNDLTSELNAKIQIAFSDKNHSPKDLLEFLKNWFNKHSVEEDKKTFSAK